MDTHYDHDSPERRIEAPAPKNLFGFEAAEDHGEVKHDDSFDASVDTDVMGDSENGLFEQSQSSTKPVVCFFQSPPQARRKCETTSDSGEKIHVVSFPIWQSSSRGAGLLDTSADAMTLTSPYTDYMSSTSPLPHKLPSTVKKLSPKPNVNPFVTSNKESKPPQKRDHEGVELLRDTNPTLSFDSAESAGSHLSTNTGTGFTVLMSQCTVDDHGFPTPKATKVRQSSMESGSGSDLDYASESTDEDSWVPDPVQRMETLFSASDSVQDDPAEDLILRPIQKRPFPLSQVQEFSPIPEETREDIRKEIGVPRKKKGLKRISPTEVSSFPFAEIANTHENNGLFASPEKARTLLPRTPIKTAGTPVFHGSPPSMAMTPMRAPPPTARKGPRVTAASEDEHTLQALVSRFDNDFEIIGEIGRGSFGMVYKVTSRVDGCPYAVKMAKNAAKGRTERDRMLKEVFALAALSDLSETGSFHIVRYHQAWMEESRLYIQTELCTSTLHWEMLHSQELKTEQRRYKVLREVLLALELIHRNGMVHLDIKPENIFFKGDHFKLGDFGLVHKVSILSNSSVSLSQDNDDEIEEGDSRYMSKELLSGYHLDLTKCDIFSLGATLYEVCLGKPLEANGPGWHAIRNGRMEWPAHAMFGLRSILQEMMHPTPSERPSAIDLLQRRHLLSEEQRNLIIEQNKLAAASMQLKQDQQLFNLLTKRPVRKLIRRATWDVDRMTNTLREDKNM
jgi:wee1-like protein kinase